MITYIKHKDIRHSESDTMLKIEYFIMENGIEYKFDVDISNYGTAVIAIDNQNEVEFNDDEYSDVIDKQNGFVAACSHFTDLGELLSADSSLDPEKKIQYIQNDIDKFCNKWDMIQNTTK